MSELSPVETDSKFVSAIWALGFRPFFLAASLFGILALFLWILSLQGQAFALHLDSLWHAHEMIHGFAVAVVIGFLYTASQSWTKVRGIHGRPLQIIAALWVAGRISLLLPGFHPIIAAVTDLSFIPVAGAFLSVYLFREGQKHNLVFLILLAFLFASNLAYHLDRVGTWPGVAHSWLLFAVHVIAVMILVICSRVLPFFTSKAITDYRKIDKRWLDIGIPIVSSLFAFAQLSMGLSAVTGCLAFLCGGLTLLRFAFWFDGRVWKFPILWILYAAYLWLISGFILSGLACFAIVLPTTATHAFTAGAISVAILGMMSRVSLGHTGRPISASRCMIAAFALLIGGAALRVFGPLLFLELYFELLLISGSLWIAAFTLFVFSFARVLWSPRVDGQTG